MMQIFIIVLGVWFLSQELFADIPKAFQSDEVQLPTPTRESSPPKENKGKESVVLSNQSEIRRKVSQLFLVTLHPSQGTALQDKNFFRQYLPAGVVIPLGENPDLAEVVRWNNMVEDINQGLPLWIATDLLFNDDVAHNKANDLMYIPPLLAVVANPSSEVVQKYADLWFAYCWNRGFNMMLGPHLCLSSSLPKFSHTLHCLGTNPRLGGYVAEQLYRLWQDKPVLMVPMGFPGGGSNREGNQPAVLLTTEQALAENDLLPYKRLIDQGCPILHVGTTLVPTLDLQGRPACISPAVITRWLREKLQYRGVIIAGPLDAPEVVRYSSPSEAGVEAFKCGADVLYYMGTTGTVGRAIERLCHAIDRSEVPIDRLQESFDRIKTLKVAQFAKIQELNSNKEYKKQWEKIDIRENVYFIMKNSITLIRNDGNLLPLRKEVVSTLGITGPVGVEELKELLKGECKNIGIQIMPNSKRLGYLQDFEIDRAIKSLGMAQIVICIVSSKYRLTEQGLLIQQFKEKGTKVIAVVLGHPSAISYIHQADAIVIAYTDSTAYDLALQALAETMLGKASFRFRSLSENIEIKHSENYSFSLSDIIAIPPGKLPITVNEVFTEGASLSYPIEDCISRCEWIIQDKHKIKQSVFTYTFPEPGLYSIRVTVQSRDKTTQTQTYSITVR